MNQQKDKRLYVVTCPYCKKKAELVTGRYLYTHRADLWHKKFYICHTCDAYVGCHRDTEKPLGKLANKELREIRMETHKAFDPIWQVIGYGFTRKTAYETLAAELNIHRHECHIAKFDKDTCLKAIEFSNKLLSTLREGARDGS